MSYFDRGSFFTFLEDFREAPVKFKTVLVIFSAALMIECFANAFEIYSIQLFSKPSLMIILLVYFLSNSPGLLPLKNLIVGAIAFSWVGDVLLVIDKQFDFLFVYGLVSFLIAHVFYIRFFWKIGILNRERYHVKPIVIAGVFAYCSLFYWYLFPNLGGMSVPVLVYASVFSLMLIACFHASDSVKSGFAAMCLTGAILFFFSDSLLALNHFAFPTRSDGVWIMLTYGIGQLLLTEGALRNLRHLDLG